MRRQPCRLSLISDDDSANGTSMEEPGPIVLCNLCHPLLLTTSFHDGNDRWYSIWTSSPSSPKPLPLMLPVLPLHDISSAGLGKHLSDPEVRAAPHLLLVTIWACLTFKAYSPC